MAFEIVTIGAATQDVFLRSHHFELKKDAHAPDGFDACLALGAKISLDDLTFATGGGATNAAVTFARFGLKTACISRVGNDPIGTSIRAQLADEGIDAKHVQIDPKHQTAYSVILVSGTGHRAIMTFRGASAHFSRTAIPWKKLATKWIYLTSVGGDLALIDQVFAFAKRENARIAWNPGNAELAHGFKKLKRHLSQTAILGVNREEAAVLAERSPRHLSKVLCDLACIPTEALLLTDGSNGAYAFAQDQLFFAPAMAGKRVNTTGAGDAFGSGFVAEFIRSGDPTLALRVATLNATGVVTHMGAKAGILKRRPTATELKKVKILMPEV